MENPIIIYNYYCWWKKNEYCFGGMTREEKYGDW